MTLVIGPVMTLPADTHIDVQAWVGGVWDGWAEQTYRVFKSVILRPRFRMKIIEEQFTGKAKSFNVVDTNTNDHFTCTVWSDKLRSVVMVCTGDKMFNRMSFGVKPFFVDSFRKKFSRVMRKSALNCGKKMVNKLSYDVMGS
jgi:hypothetical protein